MSTSRKLVVKLDTHKSYSPKHRRAARKATSTEAAQDDTEPDAQPLAKQTELSTIETPAMTQRRAVTARSTLTGTQFVCFCHWLTAKKLSAGLSLFTCQAPQAHRPRQCRAPLTHRAASPRHRNVPRATPEQVLLKILLFACQIPPYETLPNIPCFLSHLRAATTQAPWTLEASDSSDSEPEDASARISTRLVTERHPGRHTVPLRQSRPPKHPRPHQQPQHHTFLPRAFPQH